MPCINEPRGVTKYDVIRSDGLLCPFAIGAIFTEHTPYRKRSLIGFNLELELIIFVVSLDVGDDGVIIELLLLFVEFDTLFPIVLLYINISLTRENSISVFYMYR